MQANSRMAADAQLETGLSIVSEVPLLSSECIYKCEYQGKFAAVKKLNLNSTKHVIQEWEALISLSLNHENVVSYVKCFDESQTRYYLI